MKRFFSKPYRWAAVFSILLTAAFIFVLMDTFVIDIEKSYVGAASSSSAAQIKTYAAATDGNGSSERSVSDIVYFGY